MNPSVVAFVHNPFIHSALAGLVAGVAVDLHAFLTFKDWQDFTGYKWSIAAFRGFQGTIGGLLTAAGLSLVA